MIGALKINGLDAYSVWGVTLADGSLSALLTPPALKEFPNNESRIEHGTRYIVHQPRLAQRDVTLEINMTARTQTEFLRQYASLCDTLSQGSFTLWTAWLPRMLFRFIYQSCNQFSQLNLGIAKLSLKLTEPDPTDRALENVITDASEIE